MLKFTFLRHTYTHTAAENTPKGFLGICLNISTDADSHITSSTHSHGSWKNFCTWQPLLSQLLLVLNLVSGLVLSSILSMPSLTYQQPLTLWLFDPFETHSSLSFCITMFFCFSSYIFVNSFFVFLDAHHSLHSTKHHDSLTLGYNPSSFWIYFPWESSSKTTAPIIIYRPNVNLQLRQLLWDLNPHI